MAKPKQDDKKQSERFIEKARELEVDESGKKFERAFSKVVPRQRPTKHGIKTPDSREASRPDRE